MENLNTLAVQIRETGEANGWDLVFRPDWDSSDTKIPCMLALIHSEISETYMEKFTGDSDGLAAEFADIAIRVLDLAGGLTEDFAAYVARVEGTFLDDDTAQAFLSLHHITTYALEAFRNDELLKFLGALALLLSATEHFAMGRFNIKLNTAVVEKMDVNRHRSYRHGGKRV